MVRDTKIKERPILFSGPMVRAIIAGRKTQTRRVVKARGPFSDCPIISIAEHSAFKGEPTRQSWSFDHQGEGSIVVSQNQVCPYGQVGDRLWVREAFLYRESKTAVVFKAGMTPFDAAGFGAMYGGWKPSIHMPRWACRLVLELKAVRVERLQSISESDSINEGVEPADSDDYDADDPFDDQPQTYRQGYRDLWDSINAERGFGWEQNPWVWVIEFSPAERGRATDGD